MDPNYDEREMTEEEADYVEDAMREWKLMGKTQCKCPWCGGDLRFLIVGNSYQIRCEHDGCFDLVSRGL